MIYDKEFKKKFGCDLYHEYGQCWMPHTQLAKLAMTDRRNIYDSVQSLYKADLFDKNVERREEFDGYKKFYSFRILMHLISLYDFPKRIDVIYYLDAKFSGGEESFDYTIPNLIPANNTDVKNYLDSLDLISDLENKAYKVLQSAISSSTDYNLHSESSINSFSNIQNKLHFAATGKTTRELIVERMNEKEDALGLKGIHGRKVTKSKAYTAKNYMRPEEMATFNNLACQLILVAKNAIDHRIPITMRFWENKIDALIRANSLKLWDEKHKISKEEKTEIVHVRFSKYKELANA